MKICFTPMSSQYILGICDLETEALAYVPNEKIIDDHRPFGVTWDKSRLYVAQPTSILSFDRFFKKSQVILSNLWYGIHQIVQKDNKLFMMSPRLNAVKIYNLHTKTMEYFLPDQQCTKNELLEFKDKDRLNYDQDIHHYNSIFFKEDRMYISAHNHQSPSFIGEFSYPELKLINRHEKMGSQIHNIYVENGEIFTLDSFGSRSVVSNKGFNVSVGKSGQFIRGLAVTNDFFITGCFPYDPVRHKRRDGDSYLVVIDRRKKKIKKQICLRDVGNINDIRILDEPDFAHNQDPFWDKTAWNFFRAKNACII